MEDFQNGDVAVVAAAEQRSEEASAPMTDEIDFLALLLVLARRKRLLFRTTLAAALIATIVAVLLPNHYTGTTVILPPQQTQSMATALLNQIAGSAGLSELASLAGSPLANPSDIYVSMLKSRTIEDTLIGKFDLARVYKKKKPTDIRKALEDATDVSDDQKTGLITIAVDDKDPKRAADMANEYVYQLRQVTQTLAVSEASQRRLFFEQQLQQAKDSLADAEVGLKKVQQKTGMIELDSQTKALIEGIGNVRGEIVTTEVQMQAMRTFATENNPDYLRLQQQLAGLHDQLAKLEREEKGGNGDIVVATANIPAVALEYARQLREVKYRETIFDLLAQQYEVARLDESKQGTIIQVLDSAVPADKKTSPHRALIIILATLLVFVITALGVLLMEHVERDRATRERLQSLNQMLLEGRWARLGRRNRLFRSN